MITSLSWLCFSKSIFSTLQILKPVQTLLEASNKLYEEQATSAEVLPLTTETGLSAPILQERRKTTETFNASHGQLWEVGWISQSRGCFNLAHCRLILLLPVEWLNRKQEPCKNVKLKYSIYTMVIASVDTLTSQEMWAPFIAVSYFTFTVDLKGSGTQSLQSKTLQKHTPPSGEFTGTVIP